MSDPVDFDLIEVHKENIEPLREGRSALALKEVLSISHTQLRQQQLDEKEQIERRLQEIDELDDPIQPYLDYIDWTLKNFPAGRSADSGLLQLLERCTSQFKDVSYYKNDPRYLKVWMHYIKYSENPRDAFVYLARKEIGKKLAVYYEEYANYLEAIGKNSQATQVYEEGVRQEARPLQRLQRRFNEHKVRVLSTPAQSTNPSSPAFPVRAPLQVKSGGSLFSIHAEERQTDKRKVEIFNDEDGLVSPSVRTGGWDSLRSAAFRTKENRLEASTWAGETLPQEQTTPKQKPAKVSVFKDNSHDLSCPVFKIIEVPGKKPEKIDLNFELIYTESEEFCVQEVLAKMRGLYHRNDGSEQKKRVSDSPKFKTSLIALNEREGATNETIYLSKNDLKRKATPTATFYTKQAQEEIYSMFNQPTGDTKPEENNDVDEIIYDDYTEQLTKPLMNDLTEDLQNKRRRLDDAELKDIIQKTCIVAPADEKLKDQLLEDMSPSLSTYLGFYHYGHTMNMCTTLKKSLNVKQSKHVFIQFEGTRDPYNLKCLLGEGGFACVYLAESMIGDFKAIKCQKPSSAWEFYILKQIHKRLEGSPMLRSIVYPNEIHFYEDESYLILDYIEKGTLLDVVNVYRSNGRGVDETLVIFFTSELLKVIEELHSVGIMHGDLKPDNCMLRLGDNYGNLDGQSWRTRGIKLIDFGRSIDMTLFPKNVEFTCNWKTDAQDCPEMRNKETWTYQADYFGIAGIIHTMLYGCFIETKFDGARHQLASPIKRYWQQDLWNPLFDFLMNSKSYGTLPQTNVLREHRMKLEAWLEMNGGSLLNTLKEVQTALK